MDALVPLPPRWFSPPSAPWLHPKTEARSEFNVVPGEKIPAVPVKKAWRDRRTDRRWTGGGNELVDGCVASPIRTGTTFCLCTLASSENINKDIPETPAVSEHLTQEVRRQNVAMQRKGALHWLEFQ